jgi:predicted dehydrogenase
MANVFYASRTSLSSKIRIARFKATLAHGKRYVLRMPGMKMRAIVVGAGIVAGFWMAPLRNRADVVALVEIDDAHARDAVARFELDCPAFSSLDAALSSVPADVVINLTPPEHHRRVTEQALAAGCHVLTEKPMAATFEDAVAMVDAARRAKLTLAVMQNRRYHPAIRRLRQGVLDRDVGRLMALSADMSMAPRHAAGHLPSHPHPLLLDMAVHTFDQARFISGAEATRVVCHEFTAPHSWYSGAAAAIATFELEDGAVFSYRGNWIAPGFPTSYESAWRLSGAHGTVVWDSFGAPACEVAVGAPPERGAAEVRRTTWQVPEPRDRTGHAAAVDDLFDALESGRRPETEGAENVGTLAMVFAAIRSAEERRAVDMEEIVGREWPSRAQAA